MQGSGRLTVIGLLCLGLVATGTLTIWRGQAGIVLIDFHTESEVSHRIMARFKVADKDPAEGPAETLQPASVVWRVKVRDGKIIEQAPADSPEATWQGEVASPGGWPAPDPSLQARAGFIGFEQQATVILKVEGIGGRTWPCKPEIYDTLCEHRRNDLSVRARLFHKQVDSIFSTIPNVRSKTSKN